MAVIEEYIRSKFKDNGNGSFTYLGENMYLSDFRGDHLVTILNGAKFDTFCNMNTSCSISCNKPSLSLGGPHSRTEKYDLNMPLKRLGEILMINERDYNGDVSKVDPHILCPICGEKIILYNEFYKIEGFRNLGEYKLWKSIQNIPKEISAILMDFSTMMVKEFGGEEKIQKF